MGPVISKLQQDKILAMVDRCREAGGKILCGGKKPAEYSKGYYIEVRRCLTFFH